MKICTEGVAYAIDHWLFGIMQVRTHTLRVSVGRSGLACVVDTNVEPDAVPWDNWNNWARAPVLAKDHINAVSSTAFMWMTHNAKAFIAAALSVSTSDFSADVAATATCVTHSRPRSLGRVSTSRHATTSRNPRLHRADAESALHAANI